MHSSDILNDTISIESIAPHYFNVISVCERHWINRLETGVLCLAIKNQQKTQQLVSSTLFYQSSLGLIWRVSSDKQEIAFAIAAYSAECTSKITALVTLAFLRHECWPITFLVIWPAVAAGCSQVVSGLSWDRELKVPPSTVKKGSTT